MLIVLKTSRPLDNLKKNSLVANRNCIFCACGRTILVFSPVVASAVAVLRSKAKNNNLAWSEGRFIFLNYRKSRLGRATEGRGTGMNIC